jgi:MerR family transcriptional regulator/heat shock protein HspR
MATARPPFEPPGPDAAVFVISVAAELSGLHPQTLRTYERLGLITPGRTGGGGRRYSARDIELLREIADLTSAGTGIEGVRRILDLEDRVAALSQRNEELQAELESTREALRQAVGRRTPPLGSPAAPVAPVVPQSPNKLPVLRRSAAGQAVVVWRRQRG